MKLIDANKYPCLDCPCTYCNSICDSFYEWLDGIGLQKPLTLEELTESVGIPVWFESHGTYMGKKGCWMIPQKFIKIDGLRAYGANYVQADHKKDKKVLIRFVCEPSSQSTELGIDAYGTVWRAWKTKPTDEERDAAKWEE